ncbi:glycosyltransferase [Desulfotomaculum sp. 1211_IL3151]|uniref:glycosyltransferase n=1 Tax=Desulfotomaculum sp. 1211_IL3151 TaxID=3084055 RepID=UPI002FDA520A
MSEMTISLAMIVKNESSRLSTCLESVKALVDEIVIVDTGSTDDTPQIAYQYTEKVYFYAWQGDFGAARNYAISQASGDWILSLDADEALICDFVNLRDLIRSDKNVEAYMVPLEHPINEQTGEFNNFLVLRLFRRKADYYFMGRIHEQIVVNNPEVVAVAEGIKIKHGMLSSKERNKKKRRNLIALRNESSHDPENSFVNYYLGVEWLGLGKPNLALPYLEKAYRDLTDDSIMFKSAALRYLLTCLNLMKEFDKVIILGQAAALRYKGYPDVYYLTGCALEEKEEYKLAIKWFKQATQCDAPAALFSHQQGTNDFLAYYHLGFCHEKINSMQGAEQCYEQAINHNNQYHYPSNGLFLVKLYRCGWNDTLQYFREKNFFNNPRIALTVAELFNRMKLPQYAKQCLVEMKDQFEPTIELLYGLGKYHILSGDIKQGLDFMEQVPDESDLYLEAKTYMALGLLLKGNYHLARTMSLELWRKKEHRFAARVLNHLSQFVHRGLPFDNYLKYEKEDVITFYLKLLAICHDYLPDYPSRDVSQIHNLLTTLQRAVTFLPGGGHRLNRYYLEKMNEIKGFVDYKF